MRPSSEPFAHFVVALPAEARPLISHYRLKRRQGDDAFAIFDRDGISLTVSGIGKAATAAAVGYTHVLYGRRRQAVWLNVGVAGQRDAPLGSVWLGHKITDAASERSWYPGICFRAHCGSAEIRTVARPETTYAADCLYDMEASSFFESASRFATGELVHTLKVISDNRHSTIDAIDPAHVSGYVEGAIEIILHTKQALRRLAAESVGRLPLDYDAWTARWHFTHQQEQQLRELLRRWNVLARQIPVPEPPVLQRSRDVLLWLRRLVDELPVRYERLR
jgi:adenosylhomocysteine nucleosidase